MALSTGRQRSVWVNVWRLALSGLDSERFLQTVTPAKIEQMDPEFAFIDWREPEAAPRAVNGKRAQLRTTGVDPQIRVAPGHAAS